MSPATKPSLNLIDHCNTRTQCCWEIVFVAISLLSYHWGPGSILQWRYCDAAEPPVPNPKCEPLAVSFMAKEPVDLWTWTMKTSNPLRQAEILLQAGQNSSVNLHWILVFCPQFIPGRNDGLEIQLCPKVNQKMFKYADTDFTTYLTSSNDAIPVPALIMAQ